MAGGERVFVHIKSFANRARRPAGNEVVTYDLKLDIQGRQQGANVRFSGEQARPPPASGRGSASLAFAVVFLVLVSFGMIGGSLPFYVWGGYIAGSAITFFVYAWDKSAARNDRWRTQESTLHLLSLLGGWPGALVAQRVLRHKSSKRPFLIVFWGTVALNGAALIWVLMNPDALGALEIAWDG
jgi:uncharacterized membrane protein YsdA (DUF1294 family)